MAIPNHKNHYKTTTSLSTTCKQCNLKPETRTYFVGVILLNNRVKRGVKIIEQVDNLKEQTVTNTSQIILRLVTCNGVLLFARTVNPTTSEKNIVTLSNASGSTDCPNFNRSATCLKLEILLGVPLILCLEFVCFCSFCVFRSDLLLFFYFFSCRRMVQTLGGESTNNFSDCRVKRRRSFDEK